MKKINFLILLSYCSVLIHAQSFTWIKGSNTAGAVAVYGTSTTANSANTPGGRHGCGKWTDPNGDLWLFGGEGPSNTWRNDLWKYNIASNQWTWMTGSTTGTIAGVYGTMGVSSATVYPGSREFTSSWTDASGNLWLFGGDGHDVNGTFGRLGDLWKYNPTTNQWAWISGNNTVAQNGVYGTQGTPSATNKPGNRYGTAVWVDALGDFWIYGGRGLAASGGQGYLNDLWKYNVTSNQWTWISGSNVTGQYGTYGTLGSTAATNMPGARYFPAYWIDASNNLYMLGGLGFATNSVNYLDDFWKYSPTTNQWTWINGSSGTDALGVYNTLGTASLTTNPGSRIASASWKDASGNFWMFGGQGWSTSTVTGTGELNDLFRYTPATNAWTWVQGSNLLNQNGTYGTLGVAAASNMPGGREYNTWWKDLTGKFWLFGGEGYDISSTSVNHMNDLWVYGPPCSPDSLKALGGKVLCSGTPATFSAASSNGSTVWYPSATSTVVIGTGGTLSLPTSYTAATAQTVYTLFAGANNCTVAPRASITITINPLPTLTVVAQSPTICSGKSTTLSASGASTYSWTGLSSNNTSSSQVASPLTVTDYTITGTDINGCKDTALVTVFVNALPTLSISASQKTICIHHSATFTASGASSYTWDATNLTHTFVVSPTVTTVYTVTGADANGCVSTATITEKVDLCTGIQENGNMNLQCSIFPNPGQGTFNIKTQTEFAEANIELVNALGQKVFEQQLHSGQKTITTTNLPAGIYYYELKIQNGVSGKGKLVIE